MEAFGTLVSNVQVALGQVGGVTCLPLPPDPRVYGDGDGQTEASLARNQISKHQSARGREVLRTAEVLNLHVTYFSPSRRELEFEAG